MNVFAENEEQAQELFAVAFPWKSTCDDMVALVERDVVLEEENTRLGAGHELHA